MTKLGVFVGERGLWTFFREIYEDLASHYDTSVFSPKEYHLPLLSGRINRWAYRNGIRSMLKQNDVCFFEWASELLEIASHMPKYAPIVTRLHSFELADWAHRINWDRVDRIIFISDAIRRKFLARYPEQADKSVLIYNAISVDRFHPIPRPFDFSIGMLCAISPIKRVYEAIMMIRELMDLGYDPKLHIAGAPVHDNLQDRYYVSVHRLVQKLGLEQAVQFYGQWIARSPGSGKSIYSFPTAIGRAYRRRSSKPWRPGAIAWRIFGTGPRKYCLLKISFQRTAN